MEQAGNRGHYAWKTNSVDETGTGLRYAIEASLISVQLEEHMFSGFSCSAACAAGLGVPCRGCAGVVAWSAHSLGHAGGASFWAPPELGGRRGRLGDRASTGCIGRRRGTDSWLPGLLLRMPSGAHIRRSGSELTRYYILLLITWLWKARRMPAYGTARLVATRVPDGIKFGLARFSAAR